MSRITLNAVGDIWFGDHPVRIGHGVGSLYSRKLKNESAVFDDVRAVLAGADITFCNLESVLSSAGRRGWWLPSVEMRGSPDAVLALKQAGFNVASIANNHMMQHGARCYEETAALLERHGIAPVGRENAQGRSQSAIVEVRGMRVAFVGFSMRPEEYFHGRPLYAQRARADQVLEEVAQLAATKPDFLVCSLHWGTEYMGVPEQWQIQLGRQLVASGVDVVLGHHPHILQGWEHSGNGLVFYSLGNFVFDLWPRSTRKSAIAHIELEKGGKPTVRFTPIWIDDAYRPCVATGELAREIEQELRSLSEQLANAGALGDEAEYRLAARKAESEIRLSGYRYFASNLHRYPPNMLLQSVGRTVLRRLTGR